MSGRATALIVTALLVAAGCASGSGAPPSGSLAAGPAVTAAASTEAAVATASASAGVPGATAGASPGASVVAASATPSAAPGGGTVQCAETGKAGTVAVTIADFSFTPETIAAQAGQVIRFTNTGFESHNATVDGGCRTRTLNTGEHDGLLFTTTGSHPFHCTIHTWMTGTITIEG